jgi:hypothetical protein
MTRELLDFDRVRRNFDRMREPVPEGLPDRFGEVAVPLDPFEAGRSTLEILRADVLSQFAAHRDALEPFLDRASRLLERMQGSEPSEEGPTDDELRATFVSTLENIEDLCEVFMRVARRK